MWCYWNYVTERFVGFLVRSSKSRKTPDASFARRLREIAQNNLIKVSTSFIGSLIYQIVKRKRAVATLLRLVSSINSADPCLSCPFPDPNICVLHPYSHGPLAPPVLKAVKNYLLRTFEVSADHVSGCTSDEVSH
jgi:hypothetical protein